MKGIDEIKFNYLVEECKKRKIKEPTREQICEILKVKYSQASNYLREFRKNKK